MSTTADKIYEILIEEAGAPGSGQWQSSFVDWFNRTDGHGDEWRFQGKLGFGGKFWRNNGKWYVNCYPEDLTPERQETIDRTNARLSYLLNS